MFVQAGESTSCFASEGCIGVHPPGRRCSVTNKSPTAAADARRRRAAPPWLFISCAQASSPGRRFRLATAPSHGVACLELWRRCGEAASRAPIAIQPPPSGRLNLISYRSSYCVRMSQGMTVRPRPASLRPCRCSATAAHLLRAAWHDEQLNIGETPPSTPECAGIGDFGPWHWHACHQHWHNVRRIRGFILPLPLG